MYRNISDFLNDWKEESELTVKVFEAVDETKKSERLNDNVRSLERLAWHLVQTLTEMPAKAGLLNEDVLEHESMPASMSAINTLYKQYAEKVADIVKEKWTDESLQQTENMYGQLWERGKILSVLVKHQTHHRAQMTIIMRVLGMPVPGVYGPSKEEWVAYGMTPME
ncbi:MAG: DinB family protein [Flavisolibacter sp.]